MIRISMATRGIDGHMPRFPLPAKAFQSTPGMVLAPKIPNP
jgi:hypothetical protein